MKPKHDYRGEINLFIQSFENFEPKVRHYIIEKLLRSHWSEIPPEFSVSGLKYKLEEFQANLKHLQNTNMVINKLTKINFKLLQKEINSVKNHIFKDLSDLNMNGYEFVGWASTHGKGMYFWFKGMYVRISIRFYNRRPYIGVQGYKDDHNPDHAHEWTLNSNHRKYENPLIFDFRINESNEPFDHRKILDEIDLKLTEQIILS
jgi:hypothetical protein